MRAAGCADFPQEVRAQLCFSGHTLIFKSESAWLLGGTGSPICSQGPQIPAGLKHFQNRAWNGRGPARMETPYPLPHKYRLKSPPGPPSTVLLTSSGTESLPNARHCAMHFIYIYSTNLWRCYHTGALMSTIGQVGKLRPREENHLSAVTQRRSWRSVTVRS